MRKFRHDFRAHALAIKGHAQETHDVWLLAYIDEMIDASETKNEVRYTKIAAVEACRLVETGRTIRAEAYHYEKSVYIKMTNSVGTLESKDAAGRLKSKKGDTKNHGLGLEKNVVHTK